jgi:hypothetical protein
MGILTGSQALDDIQVAIDSTKEDETVASILHAASHPIRSS